ncbi:MAG TPA: MFS transporter [Anaerolineae bacterium]|nr:MFS transporter [Anaerolineae bacterium]
MKKKNDRKKILLLSASLVVVMLGFGMVIPIFPFFIEELGGGGSELGLLVATSAFLEFLCGPMWGGVSDRTGRKPILILGIFGNGLSLLLLGFSTQIWMLFAARALSGFLSSATITTALAYVSDTTSQEDRGGGMGFLGAAMALGVMLGPGLGGWLGGESLSTPFFVAAALSLLTCILIMLFLPESLPVEARGKRGSTMVDPRALWQALIGPMGVLFFMVAFFSFGLTNFEAIFGLYALEKFGYGPERVGTILMVVAIVSTLGKALLTGPTTKRWGEVKVIRGSLIAGSVGFLILLLANSYTTFLLATGFFILSKTLLRPAALALISKRAERGKGVAMGLSNSFMSLGRILGPIWAGFAFDIRVDTPYLSGAAILFIGFLISIFWLKERAATSEAKAFRAAVGSSSDE